MAVFDHEGLVLSYFLNILHLPDQRDYSRLVRYFGSPVSFYIFNSLFECSS